MKKLFDIGQFHIHKISKTWYNRLKKKGIMNNHYLLVYNFVNDDNNIHVEEYTSEPVIDGNMKGFLISDNDIEYSQNYIYSLNKNKEDEYPSGGYNYGTIVVENKYLGNYFEKDDDIVMKFSPRFETYPNFIRSYIKKFSYENFKYLIKDINFANNCIEKYKEINTKSPKNIEELIEYIKYNNPYEVFLKREINDVSFSHEFNYEDINIFYDIRHIEEINIGYEIETRFLERDNITLTIYNNVNDIVTKIEKECQRLGITDYNIIHLEPPEKNKIQIKKIMIRYKDFIKCNIECDALDYY